MIESHDIETNQIVSEFLREMGREAWELELQAKTNFLRDTELSLKKLDEMKACDDRHARIIEETRNEFRLRSSSLKKRLKHLQWLLKEDLGDITPGMIEQAKTYPLKALIESKGDMARCINHPERNPSMSIKRNHAHCFACGWNGDAIDVYRKIHGCDFKTAVLALQ